MKEHCATSQMLENMSALLFVLTKRARIKRQELKHLIWGTEVFVILLLRCVCSSVCLGG